MNEQSAIITTALTKSFGPITAVDKLDLEVKRGELFGLVGPDGAGKTTIMRLLTSIMLPTSGDARVCGFSILTEGEPIKEKIGYMAQRFGLYEDLTVMENLLFYADLYEVPGRERPARIERLLGFSNLAPFCGRLAGNLSGGMKQKLGLACSLIHTPEVLFLDEPTNGVDPVSRRDFWRILYSLLRDGITIFVSTSYLDEAERCTRVGLIHKGSMLRVDEPLALKHSLGHPMLEIISDDVDAARELIGTGENVIAVNTYGDRLHIVAKDRKALSLILAAIGNNSVIKGQREIDPSIEDVFLSLVMDS